MIDQTDQVPGERTRLVAQGTRTDDGSTCTLVVIQELNGRWTFHGLGNPGVQLSAADMVALAENILARAR